MDEPQTLPRKARGDRRPLLDEQALARLFQALPPHAMEAEAAVLGAIFLDGSVAGDVLQVLRSGSEFFKPAQGTIFDAMVSIYDRTGSMDIVQLNAALESRGVLEEVGGVDYLVRLAESTPTAANAVEHARLVRDKATIRDLIRAAGEILHDAHSTTAGADQVLQEAESRIFTIAQRRETTSASSLEQLLQETMEVLERNEGRHTSGLTSGFSELDEMTSGLQRGELLILAARPSMGKTALALNILEGIARSGKPVALFSLEMGRQQLAHRLLCARGGIDSHRLRRNMLRREDYQALYGACDALRQLQIHIDDTPGLTLLQLRSKARRLREKAGVEAIAIDYLQLMSAGTRTESRQMEVSEISRGIKAMARELGVPVLCLSQLNRASEQRDGHRPRMSDLRESGSIEQDADVVMMLHREEYYHAQEPGWAETNPEKVGVAELILAKQRNGPTGTVRLVWDGRHTCFRDYTSASPPPGMDDRGGDFDAGLPV